MQTSNKWLLSNQPSKMRGKWTSFLLSFSERLMDMKSLTEVQNVDFKQAVPISSKVRVCAQWWSTAHSHLFLGHYMFNTVKTCACEVWASKNVLYGLLERNNAEHAVISANIWIHEILSQPIATFVSEKGLNEENLQ